MRTIGFTEVYYTLWEVGEIYEEPVFYNGLKVGVNYKQDVFYVKNLSMDLEKAKAKMVDEKYCIDLELRGHSSFTRTTGSNIKNREDYYPHDCFSFGRMEGARFIDATDVWQLNRAMEEEKSKRRRAMARRRLIELGALVPYVWFQEIGEDDGTVTKIRRNYATPSQILAFKIKAMEGHHFTDGQKVTLEVKEIESFGFKGSFGWTSIRVYETKCGKIVKYVGSSPIELKSPLQMDIDKQVRVLKDQLDRSMCIDKEDGDRKEAHNEAIFDQIDALEDKYKALEGSEWYKITATIKHDNYRGPETKLIRIKLAK
jgi:hypothetical protein